MSFLSLVLPIAEHLIAKVGAVVAPDLVEKVKADVLVVAKTVAGELSSEMEAHLAAYVEERIAALAPAPVAK